MTTFSSWRTTLVLALVCLPALQALSQGSQANPSAAEVASRIRRYGASGEVLAILTQSVKLQPQQQMDEIADTIAAFAIRHRGSDAQASLTRSLAVSTLLKAGLGMSGVAGNERGTPYSGAAMRLKLIAETSEDIGVRAGALAALTKLPAHAETLPFLRKVATSQNPAAFRAVDLLSEETGPTGRAIARELYLAGSVTEPGARMVLRQLAGAHNWR